MSKQKQLSEVTVGNAMCEHILKPELLHCPHPLRRNARIADILANPKAPPALGLQRTKGLFAVQTSWHVPAVSCALLFLAGCASAPFATSVKTDSVTGAAISGKVHGGQNPIVDAHVYLYAANTTGYGNASISLLTSATGNPADGKSNYYVTTDSNGNFTITGDYTCPSTASQLYLYAVGGNPGAGTNSAAGLLAALGTCPASGTLSSSLSVFVDEVSTIATAYSIAGYATDATHVSSSGSALAQTGIANAFLNVTNLETLSKGLALESTPAGNSAVPQSTIDTLADILASCVNSTGPGSTACSTLFADEQSGGSTGTAPTDTATAAINMAHNPGANLAALYALSTAAPPFAPTLGAQPNDFTLALNFTGGGLAEPTGVAIDASGNAWISNLVGSSISKFSSVGAALSPFTGFTGGGLDNPRSVAIDGSGNVWVTSLSDLNFSKFSSAGVPLSPSTGYTGGGLSFPVAIAIDGFGNVWIADEYTSPYRVSEFTSAGAAISPSNGFTGGGLDVTYSIAIDGSGSAWISNGANNTISKFSSMGVALSPSTGFTGGGLFDPGPITIDSSGNLWAANYSNQSVTKLSNAGAALSPSTGFTGGGVNGTNGIAIDGSGNIFVANSAGSVSEFSSSGTAISPSTGYTSTGLGNPYFMAIDGSGNAWVVNFEGNSVVELIGVAAPVITPICAGLPSIPTADGSSKLGTRP